MNCLEKYRGKLISGINRNLAIVVERPGVDPVHDFRVGIKRLTALYYLLNEIDPALNAKRLLKPYRRAFKLIGDIRDVHIANDLVTSLDGIDPRDTKVLVGALTARAARDYRVFQKESASARRSPIRMPTIRSSGISERAILRHKPIILGNLLTQILDAPQKMAAKQWHKKRILLKRYHHILDAFTYCPGHTLDESELKQMKILEQLLGDWHDRVVTAEMIKSLPGAEESQGATIRIMENQDRMLLGAAKIYLRKFARWHDRA